MTQVISDRQIMCHFVINIITVTQRWPQVITIDYAYDCFEGLHHNYSNIFSICSDVDQVLNQPS